MKAVSTLFLEGWEEDHLIMVDLTLYKSKQRNDPWSRSTLLPYKIPIFPKVFLIIVFSLVNLCNIFLVHGTHEDGIEECQGLTATLCDDLWALCNKIVS